MPLTDTGRNLLARAAVGDDYTPFDATNAHIGVGNGSQGFQKFHEDLQGSSKLRKALDEDYPKRTSNSITYRATFGLNEANFAWDEWGVFNAASGGEMFSRKVEALGTKPNTQTWEFSVVVDVVNP